MKETTNGRFTDVLDYLLIALRYIASGFTAVAVYMFLYGLSDVQFTDKSWFVLFLTCAIGLITYAFHFATLDKYFYIRSAYSLFKETKNISRQLQDAIQQCAIVSGLQIHGHQFTKCSVTPKELFFALSTQTYLRSISQSILIRDLQSQMEKRLAFLNFLYCSFYQVGVIVLYFLITKFLVEDGEILKIEWIKVSFLLVSGFLLFIAARKFNKRICKREIWAVAVFFQCHPSSDISDSITVPAQKNSLRTIDTLLKKTAKRVKKINSTLKQIKRRIS